jgi:hypothetical protein
MYADMAQNEIHYKLALPNRPRSIQRTCTPHGKPLSPQLPRITRLMALAIKFEDLLREVAGLTYTDLARLGGVSRSHITHILNLLCLAPDLQERLLFLEPSPRGPDRIHEAALRRLSQLYDWQQQRCMFEAILSGARTSATAGPLPAPSDV